MAKKFVLKTSKIETPVNYTIDYEAELNPQQLEVVRAGPGFHLVIAGAGTGKTRTLVYRVAYLVESGVAADEIVLLTFTRRASSEMLDRATLLLDQRCKDVKGGTFHAFCLSVLKRYAGSIGYPPKFTLLDSLDASDVIETIRTESKLDRSKERYPKKNAILSIFSASRNRGLPVKQILEADYPGFVVHTQSLELLFTAYQAYKKKHGLMDYDDLLSKTVELFETNSDVLASVSRKCKHVLVDEYQDTNHIQGRLTELLCSVHKNVMAVGDDAQSIYGFRGADFENIFHFGDRFQGASVLKLEQNYRSTPGILKLANDVLEHAQRKYDKKLFTERPPGQLPVLVKAVDSDYESRFVVQMIMNLREQGTDLSDMAVLMRSGFNSFAVELELNKRNIPFVKFGGVKLMEAAHVKDVLSYLRVAENQEDVVAWNRVLMLQEGVGPRTARTVLELLPEKSSTEIVQTTGLSTDRASRLSSLFDLIAELRSKNRIVSSEIELILGIYLPMIERLYPKDYQKRILDLETLPSLAESSPGRSDFLNNLVLDPVNLSAVDVERSMLDENPLILSTIHSAKGLEFNSVFVINAVDGSIPSSYAVKNTEGVDEELRLFYVALTRAKDNLFISYPTVQARAGTGDYFTDPSRFIKDFPEEILEQWVLVEEE